MKKGIGYLLGMVLMVLGIILTDRADLGISAFFSFPFVLSDLTGLSYGTLVFVVYFILILLQGILTKKWNTILGLQLMITYLISFLVDYFDRIVVLSPVGMQRLLVCILGILVSAVGIALFVSNCFINSPVQGFNQVVADLTHQPFGKVKTIINSIAAFLACACCFVFHIPFRQIGIGTILDALLTGVFIDLSLYVFRLLRIQGKDNC